MKISKIIIYYIFLNIFCFYYVNNELILVYEHSRHGTRGPMSNYQSLFNSTTLYDEYNSHWDGDGLLTLKGKMQHYILGISNRYKYPDLINYTNFNPDELLIHATQVTRTKESAYNQLLGMFNPKMKIHDDYDINNEIKNCNKFYYPPNYNIWKNETDKKYKKIINEAELNIELLENMYNESRSFLTEGKFSPEKLNEKNNMNFILTPFLANRTFYTELNCINHKKYIDHNYNDEYAKIIIENFEKKFNNKLEKFFKYKNKEWLYYVNHSISIVNHFFSNYYEEKDLKEFFETTEIDKEDYYKACLNIYKWWLYHIYCDKKTCIMESSKIMEDLIGYMDNKINNKTKLKMIIDLGHDVTVGPMQLFMHETFNTNFTTCFFSCNIYFELHKEINNNEYKYYVKYFVDDQLRLNIDYDLFKKNIISKLWKEEQKDNFCNGNIYKILYPSAFLLLQFLVITIFIVIFILAFYKCYVSFKKNLLNKDMKSKLISNNQKEDNSKKFKKLKEDDQKNNNIELDILT